MAIRDLWKNISLTCANHNDKTMELNTKGNYACPLCKNVISINDFEKMLTSLEKIMIENERE